MKDRIIRTISLVLSVKIKISLIAMLSILISTTNSFAGNYKFSDSSAVGFTEDELLDTIKKYPKNSGFTDKLEFMIKGTMRIEIGTDRSKKTLNLWEVKGIKINTGPIEGLMEEICISKHNRAVSLFRLWNTTLLRTHVDEKDSKSIDIFNELNDPNTSYWKRADELISKKGKEAVLICTPVE